MIAETPISDGITIELKPHLNCLLRIPAYANHPEQIICIGVNGVENLIEWAKEADVMLSDRKNKES